MTHMLTIRLTRIGKKKAPTYRVVVQDKRKDPWGKALDFVGTYNPQATPKEIKFDAMKVKEWISKGAQPSPSVHNLLVEAKVIEDKKVRNTTGDTKKAEEPKK